eukprot:gene10979-14747_t
MIDSEDIARGLPGCIMPIAVNFQFKGNLMTYLSPDPKGIRQIYCIDIQNTSFGASLLFTSVSNEDTAKLSLEEQLRRERMRLFTNGISSYEWNPTESVEAHMILIPMNGKIYVCDTTKKSASDENKYQLSVAYNGDIGQAIDPHLSPNGSKVAFVANDDLYVTAASIIATSENKATEASSESIDIIRLTTNGSQAGITCGLADFVAQEEMDRYRGFWWSPDSTLIAYTEVDETIIPEYHILHQGESDPLHSETHRYPFAGKANPIVKLAVINTIGNNNPVWMQLIDSTIVNPDFPDNDYYLCRVGWWPDGSVMAQVQNRAQSVLQLLRLDPLTGHRTIILEEKTNIWINLHDNLYTFSSKWSNSITSNENDFCFLWSSERTGYSQLYLYKYDSHQKVGICLTSDKPIGGGGNWVVERINAVDENRNLVYFSGNRNNPTEKHLFAAPILSSSADSDEIYQ